MFYEGYNIDSEASTVNVRVGKKTPKKNSFLVAVFTFPQQLYVDLTASNMNIHIKTTLEPEL